MAATEQATLGGGCFWCLEAVFERLEGVERVVAGYAGGHVANPSYYLVCTGTTGHAEVVQVTFDPDILSYGELLEVFFAFHDPTTPNQQGPDLGTQYRSIILYHSDAQRAEAERVMRTLRDDGVFGAPIVTELVSLETFYPAEPEHQGYYRRNPNQPYCMVMIEPKVAKLRERYAEKLKSAASRE